MCRCIAASVCSGPPEVPARLGVVQYSRAVVASAGGNPCPTEETEDAVVLDVKDLRTQFSTRWGTVKAVDGVTIHLRRGGDARDSWASPGPGSRSPRCRSCVLVPRPAGRIVSGEVMLNGRDLMALSEEQMIAVRGGEIAHDPAGSDAGAGIRSSPSSTRSGRASASTRGSRAGLAGNAWSSRCARFAFPPPKRAPAIILISSPGACVSAWWERLPSPRHRP